MASLRKIQGYLEQDKPEINPSEIHNTVHVTEEDDLPTPSGGEIQLEDSTAYKFHGFVTSQYTLNLGDPTVLLGTHGALDGFIHTGGSTAIKGRDAGYFQRDMYVHAPFGQVLDIQGDGTKEVLIESVATSDAAGIGNAANLGTIDGMRVPTFKSVNFEEFDAGLTLTGESDKVFFEACPFRTVTESNVTILEFDGNFESDLIDIPNCYVKAVQSDTEVIRVDPSATINSQFQYRGTTHDETVTADNILVGDADKDKEPYWVNGCYPLSNTAIYGGYAIDASGTITINSQAANETDEAAYEGVDLATSETGLARFTHSSPNEIEYVGKRERTLEIDVSMTAQTGNDEILTIGIFKNGNLLTDSVTRFTVSSTVFGISGVAGNGSAKVVTEDVNQNDTFDVRIANLGSSTDVDVAEMALDVVTT